MLAIDLYLQKLCLDKLFFPHLTSVAELLYEDIYPSTQIVFEKVIKTVACLKTKHFCSNAAEGKYLLDD